MKKLTILLIFWSILITAKAQYYNITITRGHSIDDIYVDMYLNSFGSRSIYHITDFGSVISHPYSYDGNASFRSLIADPQPGILLGSLPQNDGCYRISYNYGKTWEKLNELDTLIGQVFGGSISGEYYYLTNRGANIYSGYQDKLSYSTSFSSNLTTVLDSCWSFMGETGIIPGELYCTGRNAINGNYYLARCTDYGQNYDSIPINDTIANYSSGKYLAQLSRGVSEGELFLVSVMIEYAGSVMSYSIYHSTDFGNSWSLQSQPVLYGDGLQDFTAGRDSCSFYYFDITMGYNEIPTKLSVFYSADCGETFTTYEHMLTPDVGLQENALAGVNKITITPNPASQQITLSCPFAKSSEMEIAVYNSTGQCVLRTTSTQEAGYIEKTINIKV